jgi:hypothetical protein
MFVRSALILCTLFTSCREPKVDSQKGSAFDLLIINGSGEDFTTVKNLHDKPELTKNVAMSLDASTDAHPCNSPNHLASRGDYIYVTCSSNHQIHVVRASDLKTVRIIRLFDNHNPMSLMFVSDKLAYTAGFSTNRLLALSPELDVQSQRIRANMDLSTLPLENDGTEPSFPRPGMLAQIGNTGFLTLSNLKADFFAGGPGYVLAFDLQTQARKALIKTKGRNTVAIYAGLRPATKNWLYIVNAGNYTGEGSVDIYDWESGDFIESIPILGAPGSLAFAEDDKVYVSNGMDAIVHSFHASTFERYPAIDLRHSRCEGANPGKSFLSSILVDKDLLLVTEFNSNCLIMVDRRSGKVLRSLQTGSGPQTMITFP